MNKKTTTEINIFHLTIIIHTFRREFQMRMLELYNTVHWRDTVVNIVTRISARVVKAQDFQAEGTSSSPTVSVVLIKW